MKRLTEKTVFSGLVTACRRAKRPTRRSPLGVTATTDGVSRSPSAFGMTVGSPPSMVAITELVVPKSMPIVRAIFVLSFYPNHSVYAGDAGIALLAVWPSRSLAVFTRSHFDHRRPQDAVTESVAGRVDGDYPVSTSRVGLDRLVDRRVECLPQRLDRCHTMFLQRGQELLLDPAHALCQLRFLLVRRQRAQSPLQVVQNWNKLSQELLVRGKTLLGAVLLDAPAIVGEVGCCSLQLIKVTVAFGQQRVEVDI